MTLQEKATEMQAESRKIVEQAKANAGKYAKFIKVLTQRKNIGTQQSSFYVELETPYMVIDGRVVEAREEHREAGKILEFEPANFHMSPDGKTQLCSVRVVSQIRGTATGTIEVGTSSPVDRTNPYANAETSALGRALGFLGYGLFGCGIASYEEVDSAMGAEAGKSKGSATANKTADTAGKSAGTDTSGTAGAAGAEGKAPTISAQIKIKTKTALVSAGFTDEEAAAKVNGARTIEDINALLQEAG